MVDTYFIDANIFLEVAIPDEGYYSECEEFFNNEGIKKTSRRVKEEVDYIVDRRSKIIPHLARHFYEKGKTKFEPPYEIESNTWDFVDDILIFLRRIY